MDWLDLIRKVKGDLFWWNGRAMDRLAGPTAANQILHSTAAQTPAWGAMTTSDLVAHGAANHTDRTRRIDLVPVMGTAFGWTNDTHGSLPAEAHQHFADGADTYIECEGMVMPTDISGTVTLNWTWTSDAAGNNVTWQAVVEELAQTDATAAVSRLNDTSNYAANATANKTKTSSIAITTPGTGATLVLLQRVGTSGGDSNTGGVSLWNIWLEYLGDM